MRKKLYVCLTYYHTLITLVKSLVNDEKYVIYLNNNIPEYADLKERLEATGRFEIIEYPGIEMKKDVKVYDNAVLRLLLSPKEYSRVVNKFCNLNLRDYELYLYHDYSLMGRYCVINKIPYHLIEDALDYFKYFDQYYNVPANSYNKGSFKFFLKEKLGMGYRLWGSSPYCIDIEVNDKNGIKIHSDKVFEVPRRELFDSLTAEQRISVYRTYAAGKTIDEGKGKSAILCTQPLFSAGHVSSMADQLKVFEEVVKNFQKDGFHIVIKPHPRDDADYSGVINQYGCGYIDKNLPSEILNYDPDARFDAAISITSTAINFLNYADEKIFMGMEFVQEVLS